MLQSTILRNSPKFKAAILQTSLIKESINMLSIIIFPNPPAEDLWNDPNNEHTQQHTPEKIKVENSAETRGGEIGLLRPGRKRWTIAVQEFRYRLGQARDHRFFAWIPRSALKHWHSAAEGNVSLGCNACLLLLSRHGRVHGVRASSRLSYSFFFFLFFSFFLLFISPPISLLLLSLSLNSLSPQAWPRIERVYIHISIVSPRGTFRTRHTGISELAHGQAILVLRFFPSRMMHGLYGHSPSFKRIEQAISPWY